MSDPVPAQRIFNTRDLGLVPFAQERDVTFLNFKSALATIVGLVEEAKDGAAVARSSLEFLVRELNADPNNIEEARRAELEENIALLVHRLQGWPEPVERCSRIVRKLATEGLTQGWIEDVQWRWYMEWSSRQTEAATAATALAPIVNVQPAQVVLGADSIRVDATVTQSATETVIQYKNGKVVGAIKRPIN